MPALIAPSILSADFANLQRDVEMLNASAAHWLHCDIMDGRFVPNLSFGLPVLHAIKRHAKKPLDVHLMIVEPEKYLEDFARAGAAMLTVHQEACPHLHRTVQAIQKLGMQAGVSINPGTPVEALLDIIPYADLVLVMSVNPGFGGQQFIERTYDKISRLRALAQTHNPKLLIEVDGGVTLENAPKLIAAGANVLVAGNTVFASPDPARTIAQLAVAN